MSLPFMSKKTTNLSTIPFCLSYSSFIFLRFPISTLHLFFNSLIFLKPSHSYEFPAIFSQTDISQKTWATTIGEQIGKSPFPGKCEFRLFLSFFCFGSLFLLTIQTLACSIDVPFSPHLIKKNKGMLILTRINL